MIAAGKYRAKAECWGLTPANNGNMQMQIEFKLLDETDAAGKPIPDAERLQNWWGSLAEGRAEEITVEALRACGWVGDDVSAIATLPSDVELVIELEEGKRYPRVRWVNPLAARGIKHADKDVGKSFAAKLKQRLADVEARAKAARGARASGGAAPAANGGASHGFGAAFGAPDNVPVGEPPPGADDDFTF